MEHFTGKNAVWCLMLPHLPSYQSFIERHRNMDLADEAHFSSTRSLDQTWPLQLNWTNERGSFTGPPRSMKFKAKLWQHFHFEEPLWQTCWQLTAEFDSKDLNDVLPFWRCSSRPKSWHPHLFGRGRRGTAAFSCVAKKGGDFFHFHTNNEQKRVLCWPQGPQVQ